jgi:ketosteroid isomerase-like protein
VEAFNTKNLYAVADLLADDFCLTDPTVTALGPKPVALQFIGDLFASHETLSFQAQRIVVDAPYTTLQFTLILNDTTYDGVDLISWSAGRMVRMEAYLTPRS